MERNSALCVIYLKVQVMGKYHFSSLAVIRQRKDQAFQTWPECDSIPSIALRVSTIQSAYWASSS